MKRDREAREDVVAGQRILRSHRTYLAAGPVLARDHAHRVDHPDERRARGEPLPNLLFERLPLLSGIQHLDREIRRPLDEVVRAVARGVITGE